MLSYVEYFFYSNYLISRRNLITYMNLNLETQTQYTCVIKKLYS